MGRPGEHRTFDAFTPTGSGKATDEEFPPQQVPEHVARYVGKPPYMTTAHEQARLAKEAGE
jgi:hypothetical protein